MKRLELIILLASLCLGVGATWLYDRAVGEGASTLEAQEGSLSAGQLAWWGGLYPEFCLPGALVRDETPEEGGEAESPRFRIRFKYLSFGDEAGGKDE